MLQSFMSVWCLGPTFPHVSNRLPATKVRNCRRQQKRTLTYNKVHTGGVKMKQKINIESGENILFSMWPDPIHCHTLSYTVIHCHVQDIYIHIYIIYILYILYIYIYYIYYIYIYIFCNYHDSAAHSQLNIQDSKLFGQDCHCSARSRVAVEEP